MIMVLSWPPASLSGHAKGNHQWKRIQDTKRLRAEAKEACAHIYDGRPIPLAEIGIKFRFEPPNRRGDRLNFPNRIKPFADGIADALGINDARFLPSYEFAEPTPGGRVIVEVAI